MEPITEDRQVLEEYFLERFPGRIMDEEAYHLLLVVLGEKPGALVMSAGNREKRLLQDFCNDLGLKMMVVDGDERSHLDKLLGRDTRFRKDSIFIAREKERFDILEESEGDFNGFSERAVGEFLGYPKEAIDFYGEEEVPAQAFEKQAEEFLDSGELNQDEIDLLDLMGYLPRPEKQSIIEAVREAEKREEKLLRIDEELGASIGSHYLEKMKTVASQS